MSTESRAALATAVLAALIATVVVAFAPGGPDLPAHLFQRGFLLQHGFSLWNNLWYAGQYDYVTYSLLYYPLAAALGINVLAVVSVAVAAGSFTMLARRTIGPAARWSYMSFAVLWPGVILTGALPFALGMALALAAVCALQRHRHVVFGVLAVLSAAVSPLAFLFLALPLMGVLVGQRANWRRFRAPLLAMGLVVGAEVLLWRL